jgi:hypothetical protein
MEFQDKLNRASLEEISKNVTLNRWYISIPQTNKEQRVGTFTPQHKGSSAPYQEGGIS